MDTAGLLHGIPAFLTKNPLGGMEISDDFMSKSQLTIGGEISTILSILCNQLAAMYLVFI